MPPLPRRRVSVEAAIDLADDLLRELTPHAGDRTAVNTVMRAWLDRHDVADFGLIALAAVQTTFVDCLTRPAQHDVPPGALEMTPPTQGAAA